MARGRKAQKRPMDQDTKDRLMKTPKINQDDPNTSGGKIQEKTTSAKKIECNRIGEFRSMSGLFHCMRVLV